MWLSLHKVWNAACFENSAVCLIIEQYILLFFIEIKKNIDHTDYE
jgi:hypothetical protein